MHTCIARPQWVINVAKHSTTTQCTIWTPCSRCFVIGDSNLVPLECRIPCRLPIIRCHGARLICLAPIYYTTDRFSFLHWTNLITKLWLQNLHSDTLKNLHSDWDVKHIWIHTQYTTPNIYICIYIHIYIYRLKLQKYTHTNKHAICPMKNRHGLIVFCMFCSGYIMNYLCP